MNLICVSETDAFRIEGMREPNLTQGCAFQHAIAARPEVEVPLCTQTARHFDCSG
jgi:hypothetical protein